MNSRLESGRGKETIPRDKTKQERLHELKDEIEITVVDVETAKKFILSLKGAIEEKGYTMKDTSTPKQAKFEFSYGGKAAGSMYTTETSSYKELHVVGHPDAGEKELVTKFLNYKKVNKAEVLSCFK